MSKIIFGYPNSFRHHWYPGSCRVYYGIFGYDKSKPLVVQSYPTLGTPLGSVVLGREESSEGICRVGSQTHLHAGGSGVRLNDGPDIKLFILVGLGRSFFVCCLAHRGSTVGFLLLQCSSGVVRHPRDLQVSVATRFCRVLIFASS